MCAPPLKKRAAFSSAKTGIFNRTGPASSKIRGQPRQIDNESHFSIASHLPCAHFADGNRLSAGNDRSRAAVFPEAGKRFARHRPEQTGGLGFACPEI